MVTQFREKQFVTDAAFSVLNHVAFIQNDKPYVSQQFRSYSCEESKFLRRGNY